MANRGRQTWPSKPLVVPSLKALAPSHNVLTSTKSKKECLRREGNRGIMTASRKGAPATGWGTLPARSSPPLAPGRCNHPILGFSVVIGDWSRPRCVWAVWTVALQRWPFDRFVRAKTFDVPIEAWMVMNRGEIGNQYMSSEFSVQRGIAHRRMRGQGEKHQKERGGGATSLPPCFSWFWGRSP